MATTAVATATLPNNDRLLFGAPLLDEFQELTGTKAFGHGEDKESSAKPSSTTTTPPKETVTVKPLKTSRSASSVSSSTSSSCFPKELRGEKGKQRGEIKGIERYRIMKLVLKGDLPEGKCVEVPKRHLAGPKYWKKEAQVSAEVLANATYELDVLVMGSQGQPIEQCPKCRQDSQKSSFVLVCCEGACSTEEGLCLPLICPCLPTHQNKQATFELQVSLVNRQTREVEYRTTMPISFRTGRKKRSPSPPKTTSPSKSRKLSDSGSAHRSSTKRSKPSPPSSGSSNTSSTPVSTTTPLASINAFNNTHPWLAGSTQPVELHWNARPTQKQSLTQTTSATGEQGYQQEGETTLGQLSFSNSFFETPARPAAPAPTFTEQQAEWLWDWLGDLESSQHARPYFSAPQHIPVFPNSNGAQNTFLPNPFEELQRANRFTAQPTIGDSSFEYEETTAYNYASVAPFFSYSH